MIKLATLQRLNRSDWQQRLWVDGLKVLILGSQPLVTVDQFLNRLSLQTVDQLGGGLIVAVHSAPEPLAHLTVLFVRLNAKVAVRGARLHDRPVEETLGEGRQQ